MFRVSVSLCNSHSRCRRNHRPRHQRLRATPVPILGRTGQDTATAPTHRRRAGHSAVSGPPGPAVPPGQMPEGIGVRWFRYKHGVVGESKRVLHCAEESRDGTVTSVSGEKFRRVLALKRHCGKSHPPKWLSDGIGVPHDPRHGPVPVDTGYPNVVPPGPASVRRGRLAADPPTANRPPPRAMRVRAPARSTTDGPTKTQQPDTP